MHRRIKTHVFEVAYNSLLVIAGLDDIKQVDCIREEIAEKLLRWSTIIYNLETPKPGSSSSFRIADIEQVTI